MRKVFSAAILAATLLSMSGCSWVRCIQICQ
jgi:hypothetical protein